jgi:hypothetical protein
MPIIPVAANGCRRNQLCAQDGLVPPLRGAHSSTRPVGPSSISQQGGNCPAQQRASAQDPRLNRRERDVEGPRGIGIFHALKLPSPSPHIRPMAGVLLSPDEKIWRRARGARERNLRRVLRLDLAHGAAEAANGLSL